MDNPQGKSVPMEENSSQQPQRPFYNEFSQINDPKVAEDLAYIEKPGRDAAIARESALREEQETGLTERERKNLEIAKMLAEEFPDAFVKEVDKNGTEIFITGLSIVHYKEVLSYLQLSSPSEGKELLEDSREIAGDAETHRFSEGSRVISGLASAAYLYVSKYGISSTGSRREFDIDDNGRFMHYEDSIEIFSDDELKIFFKMLKFLDKVGKTRREIATKEKMKVRSVEDFRNLAQQIKNTPTS